MQSAARSVPLNWKNKIEYGRKNLRKSKIRVAEICEKWKIDPDSIFLCGHSMGGNTALQSGRRMQWVKGIILMPPMILPIICFMGRENGSGD